MNGDVTYTFHLLGGEDPAGHEHSQRDGEDEEERKSQREGALLHGPQDGQTQNLHQSEQVHPQRPHLHRQDGTERLKVPTADSTQTGAPVWRLQQLWLELV